MEGKGGLPRELFKRVKAHPDRVAMRRKKLGLWEEIYWRDYGRGVRAVARGLIDLGVKPGEPVGLISENRVEWLLCDLGILAAGAVTCAMYTTSAADQVAYIMKHSGTRVIFVENEEQLDKLLEVRGDHPVERIIVLDDKGLRRFADDGVTFFDQFVEESSAKLADDGQAVDDRTAAIEPDDLAILVYTSGTTGPPKGVMLSHGNIAWACESLAGVVEPRATDEYLSFLPLCHIAERAITVFNQVVHGSVVNFAENLDTVRDNMAEVRPDVFFAVPRIWEKLYNAIELKMKDAPWVKRRAYGWALGVGRAMSQHRQRAAEATLGRDDAAGERGGDGGAPATLRLSYLLADQAVLRPLRNKLGLDRTRLAISGAAPISADVINYFQALGVPLVEGYGLTESTAVITVNPAGFAPPGTVGLPMDKLELRIAEDGEILARSPGVMLGYFKHEAATADTIDAEGWLHTGDVGEIDETGRLRITDRKKDLIITAGGKNIAPQYIEGKLRLSPYVHDAVVIGDGRKYVTALVILDEDNLVEWAQAHRVQFGTYAELAKSPQVHKLIDAEVEKANATLTHVEAIKKFRILERHLDRDEGELTPTLKVRRKIIEQKYASLIAEMY
ncbi:MAG: long-chain fatty acid--CoA ligase [Deltaproteobacteria bacterium]|jgi:long-chain acyl-CoA synthetase|nr:long-chain fatty acid--CoA ligase [Deltaproteobacteria bacterium]MBW2530980.1 long-chain fatty acid--CoA ligase [Deltaproteobacteria bacterium]